MPQAMQYCILIQSLGMMQVSKALASSRSFLEEASTISLMVNLLMALSLGQSLPQLTQTMGLTYPLLFLFLPWFLLLTGMWWQMIQENIFININNLYPFNSYLMLRVGKKARNQKDQYPAAKSYGRNALLTAPVAEECKQKLSMKSGRDRYVYLDSSKEGTNEKYSGRMREKQSEKQNFALSQNTPKIEEISGDEINSEEMDQLSQIRFLSKQCSSIKDAHNDAECSSETFSRNHLEDFSPLFDRLERVNNEQDDFILEIEDISQGQIFSQIKARSHPVEMSYNKVEGCRQQKLKIAKNLFSLFDEKEKVLQSIEIREQAKIAKGGRIKKNKPQSSLSLSSSLGTLQMRSFSWMDRQIIEIFEMLNCKSEQCLTQSNCSSQTLSTQLNYLLGSILTKIKVKSKSYNYFQFNQQFKELVEDSDQDELRQIFESNRIKNSKIQVHNDANSERQFQADKDISFQRSPTFQAYTQGDCKDGLVVSKITKINQKINSYLFKNKLIGEECGKYNQNNITKPLVEKNQQRYYNQIDNSLFSQSSFMKKQNKSICSNERIEKQTSRAGKIAHSMTSQGIKSEYSLRGNFELVRGMEGDQFSLVFTELNKHLQ